jgi:predicted MFS family arabinose efflux permease
MAVALAVDRTPSRELGAGMATCTMARDAGPVLGSVLLGVVVELTWYASALALGAAPLLLGLVLYATWMRARAQSAPGAMSTPGAAAGDGASDSG